VADAPLTKGTISASGGVEFTTATTLSATFTDANTQATAGDFSGTINWGDGSALQNFTSSAVTGSGGSYAVSGSHQYTEEGSYNITVTFNDGGGSSITDTGSTMVADAAPMAGTATVGGGVAGVTPASLTATFSDANHGAPTSDFSGTINWGDSSPLQAFTSSAVSGSGGSYTISGSHLYAVQGSYSITVKINDDGSSTTDTGPTTTVDPSIVILDPTAGGALSLSGNAAINVAGTVYVDSSSSSALSASGNAAVKASSIDVHGGVQKNGNVTFSTTPATGAPVIADPLAGLAVPDASSTPGLTSQVAVNLSGSSSLTKGPGIYSSITVSGTAKLTLQPGVYIITGGGFSVSGGASVSVSGPTNPITGNGVMIYNAGTGYNYATGADGGSFGAITLSGNGTSNLVAPSTGTYTGILIFQARDNAKALTFSGNAMQGITGTIYAKIAQVSISGNGTVGTGANPISFVVDTMTISGNAIANALIPPAGTIAYTPAQIRASYGISSLSLDGKGQTIAIVAAYDDPSIIASVDAFDNQFGITSSGPSLYRQYGPASTFLTVLNQSGQPTSLPSSDPSGAGADNWEVEEALDVEWVHAVAPGAQIILVEANSQSLSDLMASVATAAGQHGVSVVSMSWGFPEGESVFAADEASYDSTFNVPGVTFVASTGDYGAADPEYPAFSPNVVAVGGTTLNLNADNSYNSETGWGYNSSSAGTFIGGGGGISMYESEPAYEQGVQSTGSRTTPDVSLVADPNTGAWIADTYNLNTGNPFEVIGGTSLSAPAWAGLLALVGQGRAAAGESSLDSSSPTGTQQALYGLPQSDYNVITSGFNGYTAEAGYNLVTGLGTPIANSLVSDLVAYHGPGTVYAGPKVGALQNATLSSIGSGGSGVTNAFAVFSALTVSNGAFGETHAPAAASAAGTSVGATSAQSMLSDHAAPAAADTLSGTPALATGTLSQNGLTQAHAAGLATTSGTLGLNMQLAAGTASGLNSTVATVSSPRSITAQNATSSSFGRANWGDSGRTDWQRLDDVVPATARKRLVSDWILDELAAESAPWRAPRGDGSVTISVLPPAAIGDSKTSDHQSQHDRQQTAAGFGGRRALLGLSAGLCGAAGMAARNRRSRKLALRRKHPGSSSGNN
jgi:hypothetical protein